MANSMTSFGRYESSDDSMKIAVELRSVNHRYLDLNLKINHRLYAFENKIRQIIGERVKRGKMDVSISFHSLNAIGTDLLYNEALASMYVDRISKIAKEFNLVNDITAFKLANMRDIITMDEAELDEDKVFSLINDVLNHALDAFIEQRKSEGERLKKDLLLKLDRLFELVKIIEEKSPQIIEAYKEKLSTKLKGLIEDKEVEAQRIATEVVIYSDKICIDEEIVRLFSHIKSFKETLNSDGEIGKKLDFITQEMNRESNTILSKTQDAYISDIGIEIKTLIEKIREQVQNIE